ncbi:MAG: TetR family transcriptional regulator [Amycolatopsis sp.]|jgi:AcrR family transcriptional regulator|uniref:TetR/AcrR family transcriptional regulator n=1 Tax=Amycolatopsis sp. TaxID=37632 RepID=UPI002622AC1F|nr:TetR/AcrR family transcriptional regulator [Amycolatopsis sp.]MCU1682012.1 TetR family transcriptional regulator [Amycolatopsis sp.]
MATRTYRSPRREQAAANTRTAILDAAETLFAANGYAATTVNEVAAAATVGPNTVYTSVGGKPQLVVALIERAAADPLISASLDEIDTLTDGPEIIKRLAAGTSAARRSRQRAIAVMLDNLTTDPLIAEAAKRTAALLRQRLHRIAARLTAVRTLRDGTTTARATAVLWFYFSFTPWRELRDLGWTWKETERWLAEQAISALIDPPK